MQRSCLTDVQLTDNLKVCRGETVVVDLTSRHDPDIFPDAHTFHSHRFLRLRTEPGWAAKASFTATSPESLAFGHGSQACPGRFFVDVKLKVLLTHLLLNYDFQLMPGTPTKPRVFGPMLVANQQARIVLNAKGEHHPFDRPR